MITFYLARSFIGFIYLIDLRGMKMVIAFPVILALYSYPKAARD